MLNMLKFLVTNNITSVALLRYLLISYLIHIIKISRKVKNDCYINANDSSAKSIDIDVKSKMAQTLNLIYLISQFMRVF
jgi:hypothetical protein